jgi:hypothetical protein
MDSGLMRKFRNHPRIHVEEVPVGVFGQEVSPTGLAELAIAALGLVENPDILRVAAGVPTPIECADKGRAKVIEEKLQGLGVAVVRDGKTLRGLTARIHKAPLCCALPSTSIPHSLS